MIARRKNHRGYVTKRRRRAVDLRLAVACVLFPGCALSYRAIGALCGLTDVGVLKIARRALRKVRGALRGEEFAA